MKDVFAEIQDHEFDPPMTTLNVGMIRTYSDHLKLMGCVRWPSAVKEEIYLKWMDELKDFRESIGAVFRVRDHKKPFSEPKNSEFAKVCHQIISSESSNSRITTQPVTNEANVFHKFGIETLVFGPGLREGNSQTPEESIAIEKSTYI